MPAGEQPAAELLTALSQIMRTSRSVAHRQNQNLGPSGTPLGLLKALRDGDARPGDLATRLCVAPSVVSRAVVPLEASGLVERRHDPADARAWRLGLTGAGAERLGAVQNAYVQRFTQLLEPWDEHDVTEAARLLTLLEQTLTQATDDVSSAAQILAPTSEKVSS
jgi:DNA-binding MarR family transcriptional regulator